MISAETLEYYTNWMARFETVKGDQPEDHFTRFRILYPLQNRLYSEASAELLQKGIIQSRSGNKTEATKNLLIFLGIESFLSELQEKGNNQDILHLINILKHKVFNITLNKHGTPVPAKDKILLTGLESQNREEKALSIVTLIYQVRCNDTHGDKSIDFIQPLLLEPVNNILLTVNRLLFARLSE